MSDAHREPPFEGGSQPVEEHPPPVPGPGRTGGQIAVLVIAVLAIAAALMWLGSLAR